MFKFQIHGFVLALFFQFVWRWCLMHARRINYCNKTHCSLVASDTGLSKGYKFLGPETCYKMPYLSKVQIANYCLITFCAWTVISTSDTTVLINLTHPSNRSVAKSTRPSFLPSGTDCPFPSTEIVGEMRMINVIELFNQFVLST